MMRTMRCCSAALFCWSLLCVFLFAGSIATAQIGTKRVPAPGRAQTPAADPFAGLKPVASGSGIVLCAPGGSMAEFGAGCTRWLQFHLARYGELGKMPLPSSIYAHLERSHKSSLRLSLDEVVELGKSLGVTHVATAMLAGAPDRAALSYRIVDINTKKAVGSVVQASGGEEKILAELPRMAREMAKTLGANSPRVLPATKLALAEMEMVGRYSWSSLPDINVEESKTIASLMDRDPICAVMAVRYSDFLETAAHAKLFNTVLPAAADNLALMAEVVLTKPGTMPSPDAVADSKAKTFPNNYLAQLTQAHLEREKGAHDRELAAAERAVRCAPGNAQPWLTLARYYSDASERLRRARPASALTKEEWTALDALYLRETLATVHSLEHDDLSAHAFARLAIAATFAGAPDLATKAYEQAIALDPNSYETMFWGTEMFQPKWIDDEDRLKRVLAQATKAVYRDAEEAVGMANVLDNFGMDSAPVKARFEAEQKARIARDPKRLLPYLNLAHLYQQTLRYADAARMYEQLGEQGLRNANYMAQSATFYRRAGDAEQAQRMAEKEQAILTEANGLTAQAPHGTSAAPVETGAQTAKKTRTPSGVASARPTGAGPVGGKSTAGADLARPGAAVSPPPVPTPRTAAEFASRAQSLQIAEHRDEIERDYREAIRLEPRNAAYHVALSDFLKNVWRDDEALAEVLTAMKLAPMNDYYERLWGCYINLHRDADALAALKEGAKWKPPTNPSLFARLADYYLKAGDYESARTTAEQGLETFANNRYALRNFIPGLDFQVGEALFKQGKVKEAREYWRRAANYESATPLNGMAQAKKRLEENP